ncbi:MAG: hypothetical protein H7Y00_00245 [Fimbriimonadaceae bacterium]|nr:hypothetical protein [Chitinophagales bacterium]
MKQNLIILVLASFVLASCAKEKDILITPPNILKNGSFEDVSLLDALWEGIGEGYAEPNMADYYEGTKSMMIGATTCRSMTYEDILPVEAVKMYELSFALKMTGTSTGCASEFVVTVFQGDTALLYFNISPESALHWNKQKYYFTTLNDVPVTLELIVGMDKILIDDMQIIEVIDL